MIAFRKILATGTGKQLSRYYPVANILLNDFDEFTADAARWESQGVWRQDMALELAGRLGIDPTQAPSEEDLYRLFVRRKADTGEKWTREKREIAAIDLQAAPHKSVTVAIVLANSKAERAALVQAVWQANDYAMRALAVSLGVARIGHAGSKGRIQGDASWISFLHFTARPTFGLRTGSDGHMMMTRAIIPC